MSRHETVIIGNVRERLLLRNLHSFKRPIIFLDDLAGRFEDAVYYDVIPLTNRVLSQPD